MSGSSELDRFLRQVERVAGHFARQAQRWLSDLLADWKGTGSKYRGGPRRRGGNGPARRSPSVQWVDRPVRQRSHGRAGRTDPVVGRVIQATDRVCVCSYCDVTLLATTWNAIVQEGDGACPSCGRRNTVRPV